MEVKTAPKELFRIRRLPWRGQLAGYGALIDALGLDVPLPLRLAMTSALHRKEERDGWLIFPPLYQPKPTLAGHLTFALRYEGVDLHALKSVFRSVGPGSVTEIVQATPTGSYARRLWFLYEWLTGERLDLPDSRPINYVDALDPKQQFAVKGATSPRHRVRNNLPGPPSFCPLVRRTARIEAYLDHSLSAAAHEAAGAIRPDILARAASFLLLKDSKASFAIEGERPPTSRIERWGAAIGEAGQHPLDKEELLRLQRIVLGEERFTRFGWRTEGGFVGDHDRDTGYPVPVHISARNEDVPELIDGLVQLNGQISVTELDPVISAALIAFGFVFIHPFEDGNGRIHRYLIHHVLAAQSFTPRGLVFPVSATILRRIEAYRQVLERYSAPRLRMIEWEATKTNNVRVLNDTADLYRYFDATPQAEFLLDCVAETIAKDLPEEVDFLARYDRAKEAIQDIVEMPDRLTDLAFRFLHQNNGVFSARARQREFAKLTDEEASAIESAYAEAFST